MNKKTERSFARISDEIIEEIIGKAVGFISPEVALLD